MSEHRRKPPRGRGRRPAPSPQPGDRRAETPSPASAGSHGTRAEARRAAKRGGGRRRAASGGVAGSSGGRSRARGRDPQKKRFIDYPRANRDGWKRWVPSWKLISGLCLGFIGLIVGLSGIALALVDVPDPNKAAQAEKNVYQYSDGSQMVIAGGGDRNRQVVPLAKIAQPMQHAVISAENETFYEDSGVDPVGIARAVVNMALGGETQSGSTITQQYVKNTYLDQSQTLMRKVKELFISIKVGATEDKNTILAGYLNTAYYGRGAYGIQAAAQAYYDKEASELNASQAAFLAATLNGPNLYDPAGGVGSAATAEKNLKRAEARWAWILKREVETGYMEKAEYQKWIGKGFPTPDEPKTATALRGQKGYLVNLANNYITANTDITKRQLEKGGYTIRTTFDKKKMAQMRKTVEKVKKANLDPEKREVDKYVQFGGASVKPGDGAIVAIYGGRDATEHFTNNADYTGVQVGSTFKPFVLTAAMRDGVRDPSLGPVQSEAERTKVSPKSMYNGDNKVTLRNYDGSVWHDRNNNEWHQRNDGDEDRGMIDLRTAMQFSVNTPFIQLGMDVGTEKVRQAALDAGLNKDSLARTTPTFSLGTSAPSAIRLATSYATFANNGIKAEPYSVTKVVKDGETQYAHERETESAFEPNVANNITDVLRTVVEKGTGTTAKALGRPAAGKTGTTDDNKSAWFAGYTPELSTTVGMWRVNDQAKVQKFLKMYGVGGQESIHGASFPAEIWTEYMKSALAGEPVKDFPEPSPIGEKVYGKGASPTPDPSSSASEDEESPSESPSESASSDESASASPEESCRFPWDCPDEGEAEGDTEGGDETLPPGEDEGGPTETPEESDDPGGGLFGGGMGGTRQENEE